MAWQRVATGIHPSYTRRSLMLYNYINYRLQVIKFAENRLKQHQEELDGLAACASTCVCV